MLKKWLTCLMKNKKHQSQYQQINRQLNIGQSFLSPSKFLKVFLIQKGAGAGLPLIFPLTSSLWACTIHSNVPESIHFLEENEVKPEINKNKESFDNILIESIKCHHNAITNYISNNFYEQIQTDDLNFFYGNFSNAVIDLLNFFFFPNEIELIISKKKNLNGFKLLHLCFSLTKIKIPSSVTSIGECAFYGFSSLTQITISSSVTSIRNNAFEGCSSLTKISIPSSVDSFGKNIFEGIISLEITGDIQYIPKELFSKCVSLT